MSGNVAPKIVQDGLILCLDAANPKSYPGTGTLWTDLTTNRNNGTLINGPTFSNDNGGSIVFDGVDDYGDVPSSSNFNYGTGDFTWEVWMILGSGFGSNVYLLDHGANGGVIQYYSNALKYYNVTTGGGSTLYQQGWGAFFTTDVWYHIVASRIAGTTYLYKNGVLVNSDADTHDYPTQNLSVGNYGGGGYTWKGNMSQIHIYKGHGLTQGEVEHNYNTFKTKFGL